MTRMACQMSSWYVPAAPTQGGPASSLCVQTRALYESPVVVAAHDFTGGSAAPVFTYANRKGLDVFEADWQARELKRDWGWKAAQWASMSSLVDWFMQHFVGCPSFKSADDARFHERLALLQECLEKARERGMPSFRYTVCVWLVCLQGSVRVNAIRQSFTGRLFQIQDGLLFNLLDNPGGATATTVGQVRVVGWMDPGTGHPFRSLFFCFSGGGVCHVAILGLHQ